MAGGVVLTGPAGVGKSRLAEELLQAASTQPTARAVGHPATQQIPLGALAHLLPIDLIRDLGNGDDRSAFFHRARHHLVSRSGGQRLLLAIDDVDQLDSTSLALLLPLTIERQIFLIATIRSGRTVPAVIASLLKDDHLTLEMLPVLSSDEVAREALLGALAQLNGPPDPGTARAWNLAIGLFAEIVASVGLKPFGHRRTQRSLTLGTSARSSDRRELPGVARPEPRLGINGFKVVDRPGAQA